MTMAKRRSPKPKMTVDEQAAEMAQIDAELKTLHEQQHALWQRLNSLQERRKLVNTQLIRDRLQDAIGQYVKLTGNGYYMERTLRYLQPKAGDIGRLLKIGRSRALIDFGEELHTWYVALQAVGTVKDPLADSVDERARDDAINRWFGEMEKEMEEWENRADELPDEDEDQEDQAS
jgi:hypothetical protein